MVREGKCLLLLALVLLLLGSGGGSGVFHSRTDLSQAEQLEEPDWYTAGREQVEELWEELG